MVDKTQVYYTTCWSLTALCVSSGEQRWRVECSNRSVVLHNLIYVIDDLGLLFGFSKDTGSMKFAFAFRDPQVTDHSSMTGLPIIVNDKLYFSQWTGKTWHVIGVDIHNSKLVIETSATKLYTTHRFFHKSFYAFDNYLVIIIATYYKLKVFCFKLDFGNCTYSLVAKKIVDCSSSMIYEQESVRVVFHQGLLWILTYGVGNSACILVLDAISLEQTKMITFDVGEEAHTKMCNTYYILDNILYFGICSDQTNDYALRAVDTAEGKVIWHISFKFTSVVGLRMMIFNWRAFHPNMKAVIGYTGNSAIVLWHDYVRSAFTNQ